MENLILGVCPGREGELFRVQVGQEINVDAQKYFRDFPILQCIYAFDSLVVRSKGSTLKLFCFYFLKFSLKPYFYVSSTFKLNYKLAYVNGK